MFEIYLVSLPTCYVLWVFNIFLTQRRMFFFVGDDTEQYRRISITLFINCESNAQDSD